MSENQQVEWKESWRDEYLKWICGFANAQGGVLEIGRNNRGRPVGVADAEKLMEDLPNKMRDTLGIVADVDLLEEDGLEVLRITVEPYPYPVSYKGQYHYRTGSTKQELKGAALDRFLLGKTGRRWDSVPVPGVAPDDLDFRVIEQFRTRAAKSKRLGAEDLEGDDASLLERLRLTEGKYLKRAAVLLFHPDPEKFVTGASVKIGFFESDSELRFHDEIQGNLFAQVDRTMDLLLTKYLSKAIRYEGVQRIENYPVPEAALRETVLNAIAHKDYGSGVPIQISVYADRLMIWNNGQLPDDWTVERLTQKHPSQPYNPDIANAFFRAGMIEAWGRGIEKVIRACEEAGNAPPRLRYEAIGLMVEFELKDQVGTKPAPRRHQDGTKTALSRHQVGTKSALSRHQAEILKNAGRERTLSELMEAVGRSDRTKFRNQVLNPLLEAGLMEMTIPDKPSSPNQRYRTTAAGMAAFELKGQAGTKPGPSRDQVGTKSALSRHQVEILKNAVPERTLSELMEAVGRSDRTKFRNQVLNPLLEAGLMEMTIPDKPRSPNQRYRTTAAGMAAAEDLDYE